MDVPGKIKELNRRAWENRNSNISEALSNCRSAMELLRDHPHPGEEASALTVMAHCLYRQGDLKGCLSCAERAKELACGGDYNFIYPYLYGTLGGIHWQKGQLEDAGACFAEQLRYSEKTGNRICKAKALNNLGLVCSDRSEWDQSLEYYRRSRIIYRDLGNWRGELRLINNLAMTLIELKEYEQAKYLIEDTLEMGRNSRKDAVPMAALHDTLGLCFLNLKDYEQASDSFRLSMELAEKQGLNSGKAVSLFHLGQVYQKQGETESALFWLKQALELIESYEMIVELKDCHRSMAELYEKVGEAETARYHREKYEEIRVSLL